MKAPTNLKHKPIISVNDYDKIDGSFANKTDVRALSIGEAQYGKNEISLKVWRHTGQKWSRQNEEIPIHRNIDLTILLLKSLMTNINPDHQKNRLTEEIIDKNKVKLIDDYYQNNKPYLQPRLEELKIILDNFLSAKI